MSYVYVSVLKGSDVVSNHEFSGDTWMDALDFAYKWLRENRNPKYTYHVWA